MGLTYNVTTPKKWCVLGDDWGKSTVSRYLPPYTCIPALSQKYIVAYGGNSIFPRAYKHPIFPPQWGEKGGGQGMHQAWVEIHGNDHHMRTQMFVTTLHTLTSACMNLNSHDCYVWWWQQREFTVVITFMSPDKDRHILIAWDGDTLRLHLV